MEANTDNGNGKVTNAIILTKLEYIAKDIDILKQDVKGLPTRVKTMEDEISSLKKKSDGWNVLNSIGVFAAGLVGFLTGK